MQQPMPPSSFFSLPNDIIWNILSRLPKRSYSILSCVSKNFRQLIRSPELHQTRSLLDKDSIFICLFDKTYEAETLWFTLRRNVNDPRENHFVPVDVMYPYHSEFDPSIVAIGPEIFFIAGPQFPSSSMWIFDSRSNTIRQGPSMRFFQMNKIVGSVGNKLYAIGGYGEIKAESFDIETETWTQAPVPNDRRVYIWFSTTTASLNRKVYALHVNSDVAVCYDPRDGSFERFELLQDKWWKAGVCVIYNVLYVYYARFGLMWYDFELRLWRVVNGLNHLKKVRSVGMAEYNGKLALFWRESCYVRSDTKWIWCRMIALDRSEVEIHGNAEPAQLLQSVPRDYKLHHCLSVSV